jgi:hypothetical protein
MDLSSGFQPLPSLLTIGVNGAPEMGDTVPDVPPSAPAASNREYVLGHTKEKRAVNL